MNLHIGQDADYLEHNRWRWRAWIDCSDDDLARIRGVTWFLHHTFPQPVVERTSRADRFRIERTGWGAFELKAEVKLTSGEMEHLSTWLQLAYPDGEAAARKSGGIAGSSGPKAQRVFLSYGAEDKALAGRVHAELENRGYQVMDPQELKVGTPWKQATQKMLRESDMVVGLVTSEFASPFVVEELNSAFRSSKPVVAFTDNSMQQPMGLDRQMLQYPVDLQTEDAPLDMLSVMEKVQPEHGN